MGAVGLSFHKRKPMDILFNFSTNWNKKLDCTYYSTLRMSDRYAVGQKGLITLKNQPRHIGEIIAKNAVKLDSGPSAYLDVLAYLDTGYNWKETLGIIKKMYTLTETSGKIIYQYIVKNTGENIPEATLL
jgi:hypothetical protein